MTTPITHRIVDPREVKARLSLNMNKPKTPLQQAIQAHPEDGGVLGPLVPAPM